ncbi:ABC transporter substrate-binding protein [Dictyoglomus sp.]|jgi:multiple sugar transport system substrate-binding protein|uniref:ABC transporter substrate-binding protein n=1 Tax=Dictyoglomus sp. TaxID=28205 RepID=UPI003D0CFED3
MKKIIIVGMLILFVLTISHPTPKIKLKMWTLFGGGEGYIMTNLIKEFNKENPDIEIEEQIVDWGEYYNKLLTALAAGDPPDIAIMHLSVLPDYASRGALHELKISETFLDDYVTPIIKASYWKGKLYALPIDAHPIVLYYNKKVLKSAGLVDKAGNVLIPKTWTELLTYAKRVKDRTKNLGLTLEAVGATLGERLWLSIYTQLGGTFFDKRTGKITIDLSRAERAYKIIKEFYDAEVASKSLTYDEAESLFQNSKTGYHINGVWAMAVYPTVKDLEFGVTNLPSISVSVKPFTWADSHTFVFPKSPQSTPEKLKAGISFATWFIQHTYEWAKAGHLPALKSVQNSKEFLSLPYRKDYVQVAELVVYAPSVIGWTQLRQELWEIGQKVILGDLSPMDAAKLLKQKAEEITSQ